MNDKEAKRKITVCNMEVELDPSKLYFTEATLDGYLEEEGGWIDYFGAKLAEAERELMLIELQKEKEEEEFDRVYGQVFSTLKSTQGGSDKFIEGLAKGEITVVTAKEKVLNLQSKVIQAKYVVSMLKQHLRAWDKNHENAQNRGNTLRKEMERLHKDRFMEERVDEVIKAVDLS